MHAIDVLSLALLAVMGLAIGNTIAMNVRDRTHEHAVMRAIGFRPGHIIGLVLGEAAAVGFLGGWSAWPWRCPWSTWASGAGSRPTWWASSRCSRRRS